MSKKPGPTHPGIGNLHRFKAYTEVLREHGLAVRKQWVCHPPALLDPEVITRRAIDQLFPAGAKEMPDAIFAVNDGLALPALEEMQRRKIRVPDDVAVIGMQDLPISGHPAISLSTLREPVREMGEAAARVLIDLIEGRAKPPVQLAIPSCELLIRRTTAGG